MLDNANESGYTDYYQDVINQHIEAEVSRRMAAVQEGHEKLKQDYQKLHDICNNYYQSSILSDYSST